MKIEINDQYHFKTLTPSEGYVLTDWDGQDIVDFTFAEMISMPLSADETLYREITIEEKDALEARQAEAIAEDEDETDE